jgi:hypothetical protein
MVVNPMKHVAVLLSTAFVCAGSAIAADTYSGPQPPKPDIPYLLHADNLVETEVSEAKEDKKGKNDTVYVVPGASSPARTPVAEPIFLFESDKITPDSLELYRMEVKNGRREVSVSSNRKKSSRPLRLMVTRVADRLYRIEVNEGLGLENGEYSLTPNGSNTVFCFEEY